MAILRGICISSCSLLIAGALLATEAAAEAVQVSMTVDANTTALYRFREGSGTTSANDVSGGKPINVAMRLLGSRDASTMPWQRMPARNRMPATPISPTMRRITRGPP